MRQQAEWTAVPSTALPVFLIAVLAPLHLATAALAETDHPHGERFELDCALCHTVDDWRPLRSQLDFDHATTGFPLDGGHEFADCGDCHETPIFSNVGTGCEDCHADPHLGELGFECAVCHDTTTWENQRALFDAHDATLFPLLRPHAHLDCESCHGGQRADQFATTPTDCFSCHQQDFTSTTDPDHTVAGFSTECEQCHNPLSARWDEAVFAHPASFPLVGGHARAGCEECHAEGFAGTPTACESCHLEEYRATRDPDHAAAGFDLDCAGCHGVASWSPALSFDHAATGFLLRGQHQALDCESCHATGFAGTPTECFSCHLTDFENARDPDHTGFPTACESCHSETGWEGATFQHDTTGFPLRGRHQPLDCEACHATGFEGTPTECFSCHQADYEAAQDPDHGGFSTACESCHSETGWEGATFNHDTTGFPLRGRHQPLDCEACHATGFEGTPTECFSCHQADYEAARDPDHGGFPTACETCHSETGWEGATFNHDSTGFPLRGRHRPLDCESCHEAGFDSTPSDCFSCHQADYEAARDPDHGGFPTTCESCHSETGWEDATFNHDTTGFPLRGRHRPLDCESCHETGFAGTPTDCFSCHRADYRETRDPNHAEAGFPTSCETCHDESSWETSQFDHSTTGFLLRGQHRNADCESCHSTGYAGTPRACFACHRDDYESARDPNHADAGFPRACQSCHNENTWQGANFDHNATGFPLNGSHQPLDCDACHAGGFAGTPRDCYSCHQTEYETTEDPNHVEAGFPTTCESCHNETTWDGASFDHSTTGFLLRGAHEPLDCESCHAGGFAGTPTDCFSCHETEFRTAGDPDHVEAGFPTTCETCHDETRWDDARFDHDRTAFPLRDSHAELDCESCHAGGFSGTPTDCFSCHAADYNRANNPDHGAAGFPTACESCHRPTRWNDSDWDHSQFFPIYRGSHRGEWDTCADCHVAPGNFTVFECILCHEHRQSEMDDEHDDVRGYRWESRACYDCHPNGEE